MDEDVKTVVHLPLTSASKWDGWFAAPAPFGTTEFNLTINAVEDNVISGSGKDTRGEFQITGKIYPLIGMTQKSEKPSVSLKLPESTGRRQRHNSTASCEDLCEVEFTKNYDDPKLGVGILYKGTLRNCLDGVDVIKVTISGKYHYTYKAGFISMDINEQFEMTLDGLTLDEMLRNNSDKES